jgi:hypothetical protein
MSSSLTWRLLFWADAKEANDDIGSNAEERDNGRGNLRESVHRLCQGCGHGFGIEQADTFGNQFPDDERDKSHDEDDGRNPEDFGIGTNNGGVGIKSAEFFGDGGTTESAGENADQGD